MRNDGDDDTWPWDFSSLNALNDDPIEQKVSFLYHCFLLLLLLPGISHELFLLE